MNGNPKAFKNAKDFFLTNHSGKGAVGANQELYEMLSCRDAELLRGEESRKDRQDAPREKGGGTFLSPISSIWRVLILPNSSCRRGFIPR